MYRLTLLGPPSLRDRSGREITAISGSPERLLLLAWLACEEPVSFHKRDTLLDRFFPDGDRDVRRNALRQALHALRTYIDPAIFVARGSDELMLNSALLSCDLTEVRARLRANDTVDRDGIGTFVDGVDTATLPVPVRSWVHDRRTEVSAIQDGTAEYPVVVAEPEPVPDRGRGAPGATSRDRRTKPAIPPTPRTTPAIESAADTPRAASLPSVTRADYAERLNRGMRNRPPTGDDSAARAWTAVAAGVVLALVVGALWLWLKNRPATPDVAEAPETPTTITGAALDTADSLAFAQLVAQATAAPMDPRARGVSDALLVRGRTADAYQLLQRIVAADSTTPCRACAAVPALAGAAQSLDSFAISEQALRRWMQRDPAQPEPARRLAEQVLREGRLAEAALLVDSAQARGAGALWARQQRMERAMAGGFWPVARDLVVDSFAPGMSGARARWWRVTFERLRGRPASAAAYARALLGLGVPASQEQGDAISPSEMRAVATLALLDAGDVAGARALLAEPLARRDSGPLLVEEAVLRARLHAAAGDTAALAALADSIVRTSLAGPHARSVALRHYLRGIAAAARGVHDDAVTHFEAALRVDRVHAPAINVALARSLLALGRPADAIPVLRSATRARVLPGGVGDEPFPVVREQLALAHAAIGARDSARVHARVALDAWNESEAVIRVRGNALRRAVGLVRRPRADGAAGETP